MSRRLSALVPCLLLIAACGGGTKAPTSPPGGTTPPPGGSTSNAINVGDNFFDPASTTLAVGTTVTWTWTGRSTHDVTFDNANVGNSGRQASGTFQRTFSTAGTYDYHCTVHGIGMSGTVVIK